MTWAHITGVLTACPWSVFGRLLPVETDRVRPEADIHERPLPTRSARWLWQNRVRAIRKRAYVSNSIGRRSTAASRNQLLKEHSCRLICRIVLLAFYF
jgi:hypothetical protein